MFFINSLLEQFEIQTFIGISSSIINLTFINITSFTIYVLLVIAVFYFLNIYTIKNGKLVSTNWNITVESLYSTIQNMVISQIGLKGMKFFLFIYALFLFILLANIISMILYNFAINAQLIYVISLSITIWLGVTIMGFAIHKLEYFGLFVLSGTSLVLVLLLVVIEAISNLARSISLGLRLGANVLSGHLLLTILCGLLFDFMTSSIFLFFVGLLLLAVVLGIVALEFAIAAIQAYVFCILTCSYIKDAVYLH